MITVLIDELTPCLMDTKTNELVETEVVQITRKSFLQNFSKRNGWYTDWSKLLGENEIYALVIKGTTNIQGLIAIKPDYGAQGVYITWMVTNPDNNKMLTKDINYIGVGGHLFAIAIDCSIKYGFSGVVYGFAKNKKLLEHYKKELKAEHLGVLHPYHFCIDEVKSAKVKEKYTYEWTNAKL